MHVSLPVTVLAILALSCTASGKKPAPPPETQTQSAPATASEPPSQTVRPPTSSARQATTAEAPENEAHPTPVEVNPAFAVNAKSPLGINLHEITYDSGEWPFLDAFKAASYWVSRTWEKWDTGVSVATDKNGWPTQVPPGQIVTSLIPTYGGGRYMLLYEGRADIKLQNTTRIVEQTQGRIVYEAAPNQQVMIDLHHIDNKDPIRNIRAIPTKHMALAQKQSFLPLFLERLRPFSVIRFMDWGHTNGSPIKSWKDRTPPTFFTQARPGGVAYEYMIELVNLTGADPWICIPHQADDDFLHNLARLFRARLHPKRKLYIEYSNELWNDMFPQSIWVRDQAVAAKLADESYQARLRFQARRSQEIFQIFEQAFAGHERLVRVIASQTGNAFAHQELLADPKVRKATDALAIAPYFGLEFGDESKEAVMSRQTADWLTKQLQKKSVPETLKWVKESQKLLRKYKIPMIAYEGGQHLVAHPVIHNNKKVNALMDAANRHPRMATLYRNLLDGWKQAGGQLFMHYGYAFVPNKWGRWGALEMQDQPLTGAPKMRALIEFSNSTSRWW